MLYINEKDIQTIGIDWVKTIDVIDDTVKCLNNRDFHQPIKPYLRFRIPENRIIAMPAFVGGKTNIAGIKWISSFPNNINNGKPRANSILVLNDASTGEIVSVINTNLLSVIRTVSVSGLMIKYFDKIKNLNHFNVGVIGWGPIGRYHTKMLLDLYGDRVSKVLIFDIRGISRDNIEKKWTAKFDIVGNWYEAYHDADVFITCTTASTPYIDKEPKKGSLHLNVSLRDYCLDVYDSIKSGIIVDDWDEVCRQGTNIETMSQLRGLKKEDTISFVDVVCNSALKDFNINDVLMFNPMGLAVFDVSIGKYYFDAAKRLNLGVELN